MSLINMCNYHRFR